MKTALLALLILLCKTTQAQNENALCWQSDVLQWSDFQGEAKPNQKQQKNNYDISLRYKNIGNFFKPKYVVEAVFDRNNSWNLGPNTAEKLKSAHLLFDLAEMFARKIRLFVAKAESQEHVESLRGIDDLIAEYENEKAKLLRVIQDLTGDEQLVQLGKWQKLIDHSLQENADYILSSNCQLSEPGQNLNEKDVEYLIKSVSSLINDRFVDVELGQQIVEKLNKNLENEAYKEIKNDDVFLRRINADLFKYSQDKHLQLSLREGSQNSTRRMVRRMPPNNGGNNPNVGLKNKSKSVKQTPRKAPILSEAQHIKFEILAGNVGLLTVLGPLLPEAGTHLRQELENAMTQMANVDALIFDVRGVPGGVPSTVALLSSYLYKQRTLLNTYYSRSRGASELYADPSLVNHDFSEIPNFVLINRYTASGGEAFAYMNQQHRALTVIGETSAGAGRLSAVYPISQTLNLTVSENHSVHPVSQTGFEKIGVIPDIKTKPQEALHRAHLTALQSLKNSKNASKIDTTVEGIEAKRAEKLSQLSPFTGHYESRLIDVMGEHLIYQVDGRAPLDLKKLDDNLFQLHVPKFARAKGSLPQVRFNRNDVGEIVSISLLDAENKVIETFIKDS